MAKSADPQVLDRLDSGPGQTQVALGLCQGKGGLIPAMPAERSARCSEATGASDPRRLRGCERVRLYPPSLF